MKSLYRLLKRIEARFFFTLRHVRRLGLAEGLRFARAAGKPGQTLQTALPDGGQASLRGGTSDVSVFEDTFLWRHYDLPYPETPHTIIDAGAHIGLASLYFAKRFPDAKIFALEPHPENFKLLVENCANAPNITPINSALWTEEGSLAVEDPDAATWSFRFHASDSGDIDATSIPALVAKYGLEKIDLLKIDVEGSEKEIFEHDTAWLSSVGSIVVELHDDLKPGCTRAFYAATPDFIHEARNQENLLVSRRSLPA